jgi:hypothetical protein
VKVVPEIDAEESGRIDSVKLKIEGNKIIGTGKAKYYGFTKVFSGYDLDRGDQEGIGSGAMKLVAKGSNKFNLRNYQISNLANQDLPNELTYEFDVADYFQTIGDETYINLDLTKDFYNASIKVERKTPKESEYKYEADEIVELQIPEGLKVEYLPPNAAWAGDLFAVSVSYKELEGKVVYRKKIKMNYLMMTSEQFPDWNKAVKAVSEASKESIVLKKK